MSTCRQFRYIFIRPRKLQSALRLLPFDHIHFGVVEARLSHLDFIEIFSSHLLFHFELWNMLCCGECIGERIKILKAVFMGLVNRKGRPLCLKVEVDEASRSRLYHCLMKWIHGAKLKRVELMLVHRLFHLFSLRSVQRSESLTSPSSFLLVSLREVFFVLPDFVKFLGATVGETWKLLWSLSLIKGTNLWYIRYKKRN